MVHHAAIHQGIVGGAPLLFPYKTIIEFQMKVREGNLVEEMSELVIEVAILIISDLHQAVLDAEGISEIVPDIVMIDLDDPVVDVFAVE